MWLVRACAEPVAGAFRRAEPGRGFAEPGAIAVVVAVG